VLYLPSKNVQTKERAIIHRRAAILRIFFVGWIEFVPYKIVSLA